MPDKKPKKKVEQKSGYNPETVANVKDYFQRYYQSNFFKDNIKRGQAGWNVGVAGKVDGNEMANFVKNINVKIADKGKSENTMDGKIVLSKSEMPLEDAGLVTAHEVGHSKEDKILQAQPTNIYQMLARNKAYLKRDNLVKGLKQDALDRMKSELVKAGQENANIVKYKDEWNYDRFLKGVSPLKDKVEDINRNMSRTSGDWYHDDSPNEIRADILGLRYLAQRNKIWDPVSNQGEQLDDEKYKKIMNMKEMNNKGESEIKKRLKHRFDDATIKFLLKNIAANKRAPVKEADNNV